MKAILPFTRGLAALLCLGGVTVSGPVRAQVSDDVVKVGVLTDMSGQWADMNGPGSLLAACRVGA
ncbi:hypothetical protein [Methylobacterium sp. TER-1]|uniref:hypothetical protein n=1 Tax=Methylobacterium oryzihabitans TaxID=2499852 RepID=UPI001AEEB0E1